MAKQPRSNYKATATLNTGETKELIVNTTTSYMAYRVAERALDKQGIRKKDYIADGKINLIVKRIELDECGACGGIDPDCATCEARK